MATRFTNLGEARVTIPPAFEWEQYLKEQGESLFSPRCITFRENYGRAVPQILGLLKMGKRIFMGRELLIKMCRFSTEGHVPYEDIMSHIWSERLIPGGPELALLLWKEYGGRSFDRSKNKLPIVSIYSPDRPEYLIGDREAMPCLYQEGGYYAEDFFTVKSAFGVGAVIGYKVIS